MKSAILASYYADACNFASTEETRYYLRGVNIEPSGHVAATNGHVLFAAYAKNEPENFDWHFAAPVIVPFDKAMLKACKAKSRMPLFMVIEHAAADSMKVTFRIVLAETAAQACESESPVTFTLEGAFIDGSFPDWRRVVPRVPKNTIAAAPAFDARYIERFGAVAQGEGKSQRIRIITCSDEASPLYVDIGRKDAFGVLMPMRADTKILEDNAHMHALPEFPAWASATPTTDELAAAANGDTPAENAA